MGIICSICNKNPNDEELVPLRSGSFSERKIVFNRIKTDPDLNKPKENPNEGQYLDRTMKEIMDNLSSDEDDILETKEYEEILKQLDDDIQKSIEQSH